MNPIDFKPSVFIINDHWPFSTGSCLKAEYDNDIYQLISATVWTGYNITNTFRCFYKLIKNPQLKLLVYKSIQILHSLPFGSSYSFESFWGCQDFSHLDWTVYPSLPGRSMFIPLRCVVKDILVSDRDDIYICPHFLLVNTVSHLLLEVHTNYDLYDLSSIIFIVSAAWRNQINLIKSHEAFF